MNKLVCISEVLVKFVILSSIIQPSIGENYLVGGELGWGLNSSVERWSQENTFIEGDIIVFMYEPFHSVMEVNEVTYNSCALNNPISIAMGT